MVEQCYIQPKVEEIASIADILPTPVPSPIQQSQIDDEIEAAELTRNLDVRTSKRRAAVSRSNIYLDNAQTKRPRGRPPKTEPTRIPRSTLNRMSESDRKYLQMRIKNNEASRRSRLSRKGKEEALFDLLSWLEDENLRLTDEDADLDIQIARWRKKLMKLAQL